MRPYLYGMSYQLAREQASGPHHAYDAESQSLVCGWLGHRTIYPNMQFNPAHPAACANCSAAAVLETTGALPSSSLVPGERVEISDLNANRLFLWRYDSMSLSTLGSPIHPSTDIALLAIVCTST
jgi:hypothetical protein